MNPLLSIIIPTKNRYQTLFSIVDTIISFQDSQIEIVIQDNSDDNSIALKYIENKIDVNSIKYYYESKNLSVIENSDLAVKHSIGDYVCFIGDDDGVMPYISQVVQWMKRNKYKALKSFKPNYYWPNQKSNYLSNDTSGNFNFKKFTYSIKKVCSKEALNYTLNKGGTTMKMLPCLYHGIVERKSLNEIYDKCQTFFPGPSPDMANAIALTQVIDKYIYVDFPVIISGKSGKSTGGQGVLHKHIDRIEDVPHLPKYTARDWTDRIPKYWTGPTIWAESVVKALKNWESINIKKQFNYHYLYAVLYVFHMDNRNDIFKDFKYRVITLKFYKSYIIILINRIIVFFENRFSHKINKLNKIENIAEAINVMSSYVDDSNLIFNIQNKYEK